MSENLDQSPTSPETSPNYQRMLFINWEEEGADNGGNTYWGCTNLGFLPSHEGTHAQIILPRNICRHDKRAIFNTYIYLRTAKVLGHIHKQDKELKHCTPHFKIEDTFCEDHQENTLTISSIASTGLKAIGIVLEFHGDENIFNDLRDTYIREINEYGVRRINGNRKRANEDGESFITPLPKRVKRHPVDLGLL